MGDSGGGVQEGSIRIFAKGGFPWMQHPKRLRCAHPAIVPSKEASHLRK